jgi:hypothetical protein
LQDEAWKQGEEIGKFDKTTLKYCKMAAHFHGSATVPAAAEIAWLMQEEHALVNPRAYAGTRSFIRIKVFRLSEAGSEIALRRRGGPSNRVLN